MTPRPDAPPTDLYPELEPYAHGMLEVGDRHSVYWETSGSPTGRPVLFLHGGPGGGCAPVHRRLFDPSVYRIVCLDQRGCGRSTPNAGDPDADLSTNTTQHLLADLELLRQHLGVRSWLLFGGSWGATLALAYAQSVPSVVTGLILRGVFTARRKEVQWYYDRGAAMLFPEAWERLLAPLRVRGLSERPVIEGYRDLLHDDDPDTRTAAAVAWSTWEAETVNLVADEQWVAASADPAYALAFARLEAHYFSNGCWLEEGQLIDGAEALAGIPGIIVQGRYDIVTPPTTAWELHRAWPGSELVVVPGAGHSFTEPGIRRELLRATAYFASAG